MSAPGVVLMVRLLFGQEVFHQKLLHELFVRTQLARTLGLWQGDLLTKVGDEKDKGLFDLKLLGKDGNATVGIELKVNDFLGEKQEERQREFAVENKLRRAYILLGPTYYCWRAKMPRIDAEAKIIEPPTLARALAALLPDIKDEALSSVVVEYMKSLNTLASYWEKSYVQNPDKKWIKDDWNVFRFLAELGTHSAECVRGL